MRQQHRTVSKKSFAIFFILVLSLSASSVRGQWEQQGERGRTGPFAMTVGVIPGVCSNSSSIEVPSGTTVHYCYDLFDPPPFPYAYNITDDILGFIASGNSSAGQRVTEFASIEVFANVTNVGNFTVFGGGSPNGTRGMAFPFSDNATVIIGNGTGGGGQFDGSIPTLSEFSMFAFGGLLLLGAAIMLRRTSN